MVRRKSNVALKLGCIVVKCCHMSLYRRMGVGMARQKGQDNSNATLQLSFVIRHVLPHVTGTEKDAGTIVTYRSFSNSTVLSQTIEMQALITN